ncbi:biotin/lipoyl-containing protein [Clostridium sp.]|uniref:biotin/lipoyl-containing protein n=1 Tax=Clostridium sp. TaxID=1506 RepID=UPI003F4B69E2
MEKYKISLNGKVYEVEVEKLEIGAEAPVKEEKAQVNSTPKVAEATPSGSEDVTAPIPGGIWEVKVKVGDLVKAGQVLVVIEAMKLENEIVSPKDAKVTAVNVTKGDTVALGDKLVSLQ